MSPAAALAPAPAAPSVRLCHVLFCVEQRQCMLLLARTESATKAGVNTQYKNGDTPLAQALLLERLAIAEMLREAGAKEEADELEEFTHEGERLSASTMMVFRTGGASLSSSASRVVTRMNTRGGDIYIHVCLLLLLI